ncbi:MAG: glycosyl hydrolase-related protein [Clostridiales bacterium]|jgi:hypothetical protein|nr:glycosyl hydrolase-related protein [Clostridiales bacterium]
MNQLETLETILPVKKAFFCDMLENNLEEAEIIHGEMKMPFKPFEVKTIRIALGKGDCNC